MREKEFNLIEEKWIRVMDFDGAVTELSLNELFSKAHEYRDLCGELATQDFAMLRLLLAILHTVFSRYDLDGNESPLECTDDALDRWKALWDNGQFPIKPIEDYLTSQKENFYLFHPERPFYQVEHARVGTKYEASKLNGTLSESSNKFRLFQSMSGQAKESMTFAEAARWLLYVNAFDDTSAKPSSESKERGAKLPSVGAGWLGKLGLVCIAGKNIFETLMLNLVMLTANDELYGKDNPIWEHEVISDKERVQINMPDNLAALYTLQSRRLYLKKEGNSVTGYNLLGGDFFEKENAFIEPMTVWKKTAEKSKYNLVPKRHSSSKQFWRDFSSYIKGDEEIHEPGVISWIANLKDKDILPDSLVTMKIASVEYGDKDFFVVNTFSDSLQLHSSLIAEMDGEWQQVILNSIAFCDDVSKKVWTLAKDINLASGGDFIPKDDKCSAGVAARNAKADFYNRIDAPFRKWLHALNPSSDDSVEKEKDWRKDCIRIAEKLGKELISEIPSSAIFGKLKDSGPDNKKTVSAASAYNLFIRKLNFMKNN